MWLGASGKNTAKPLGIAWTANSILALGINFSYNDEIFKVEIFQDRNTNSEKKIRVPDGISTHDIP